MKRKSTPPRAPAPTEDEIRAFAHHLYQQSDRGAGHDLAHWLEAEACLKARIPKHLSHAPLHRHVLGMVDDDINSTGSGLDVIPL